MTFIDYRIGEKIRENQLDVEGSLGVHTHRSGLRVVRFSVVSEQTFCREVQGDD